MPSILEKAFVLHDEALKNNSQYYDMLNNTKSYPLDCAHMSHKIDDTFSVFISPLQQQYDKVECDLCDFKEYGRDYYIFNHTIKGLHKNGDPDSTSPSIIFSSSNWHNFSVHQHTEFGLSSSFMLLYNKYNSFYYTFEYILFGRPTVY